MSVVDATEADLAAIRKLAPALADSALGALALALASEIDEAGNSATSKSMCARALTDVLGQLRDLTPENGEGDSLDDLSARRATRLRSRSAEA